MNVYRHPPDDPREWLNRARSNLVRARGEVKGVYLEDLCFDAQQAAEKAIKALLVHCAVRFPYVHDLTALLTLVEQAHRTVPQSIREAARLTRYAVGTRYPGVSEPVTHKEYEEAVILAEEVVHWVESILKKDKERIE